MEDVKKWYNSKTIWASILVVVTGVLQSLGFEVPEGFVDFASETILGVAVAIGGLVALYGRIKAIKKIA